MDVMDNPNPTIYEAITKHSMVKLGDLEHNLAYDPIDAEEIFDYIRHLNDPEHPNTLEQLRVLEESNVQVDPHAKTVKVYFTPTIKHCSQATLIGLMIKVKLIRCLPLNYKVTVLISPGSHDTENVVNKQLNDKERVAAALENPALLSVINRGVANTDEWNALLNSI
eukprot:GDKK01041284.1.p1 GENE.GDKK01041284.1~~GDKK01041284.1.p1  ORF type:complete len:177 (-),score=23.59 GDKK01041284.1:22-522(-)